MSDVPNTKPQNFADLANQPSGAGVAADQAAFMEAAVDGATANASCLNTDGIVRDLPAATKLACNSILAQSGLSLFRQIPHTCISGDL